MRSKPASAIHGWIVLDKPLGLSSARAVAAVKRAFNAAKAGHAGTLDPLATGVLPIALGEATKTVPYVVDGPKVYRFTVQWGEARTTDDAEGDVVARSDHRPSAEAIRAVLPRFTGTIDQRPPAFSAIKVSGQRAYALARAGVAAELAARSVTVRRLELVAAPDADRAVFEAEVGPGTYVRSLARDLGEALETRGFVTELRRLAVGRFGLNRAIPLDNLTALGHSPAASGHLLPLETALDDIPALALTEDQANALRCGRAVTPFSPQERACLSQIGNGATICATSGGKLVALAEVTAGEIRPLRVLNI
ncbi:MAG: tRNA pseudouridine(55) synthase TruB [Alphaproteobacteria bacterium]|nr:tRNA pseudouridine(55) synthase TruB [Alphaproteobacteria bacterium]